MMFLVPGGAGFIGSHVCERLLGAGHAVWAFDEPKNSADQLNQIGFHGEGPPSSQGRVSNGLIRMVM